MRPVCYLTQRIATVRPLGLHKLPIIQLLASSPCRVTGQGIIID